MMTYNIVFFLIALLVCLSGCVGGFTQFTQTDNSRPLLNYALSENGAKVVASHAAPGHEPETAINGVASSEHWDKGEGWEAEFEREHLNPGYIRIEGRVRKEEHGGAWLEVHFPEPRKINRVVVHTLNSSQYPASNYGVYEAALQAYLDYGWMTLGMVKNGKVEYPTKSLRYPAGAQIEFKFAPTTTDKVRFVVYRSNDRKVVGKESIFSDRRDGRVFGGLGAAMTIEKSTARIVEIEITGFEFADASKAPGPTPPDDEEDVINEVFDSNAAVPSSDVGDVGAQVEAVVHAYATAYRNRDLSGLMATISPDYARDNEDYRQLRAKMEALFDRYTTIDFSLQRLRLQYTDATATVETDYRIALALDGNAPSELSGKLFFSLVDAGGGWKIVRIDTQR
jgi:ketosteroid isomerase-like protein